MSGDRSCMHGHHSVAKVVGLGDGRTVPLKVLPAGRGASYGVCRLRPGSGPTWMSAPVAEISRSKLDALLTLSGSTPPLGIWRSRRPALPLRPLQRTAPPTLRRRRPSERAGQILDGGAGAQSVLPDFLHSARACSAHALHSWNEDRCHPSSPSRAGVAR